MSSSITRSHAQIPLEATVQQLIERVIALKIEEIKNVDMDCCVVVGEAA